MPSMHPSSANTVFRYLLSLWSQEPAFERTPEKHLKEYAILSMLYEACLVTT